MTDSIAKSCLIQEIVKAAGSDRFRAGVNDCCSLGASGGRNTPSRGVRNRPAYAIASSSSPNIAMSAEVSTIISAGLGVSTAPFSRPTLGIVDSFVREVRGHRLACVSADIGTRASTLLGPLKSSIHAYSGDHG